MSEGAAAAPAPAAAPAAAEGGAEIKVTSSVDQGASAPSVAAEVNAPEAVSHWTESLDPDMKNYVDIKGFKDPVDILNSYRNFEKLQGAPQERVLKLPNEADSQDWEGVYQRLGKPPTPEGYGFEVADDGDKASVEWMAKTFHELNLTKDQGARLAEKVAEYESQVSEAKQAEYNQKIEAEVSQLKKDWGMAYDKNIATAKKAARAFGIPDNALDALEQAMGFKGTMNFLHDLGTKVSEAAYHSDLSNDAYSTEMVLNPEQAKAKINALKKDRDFIEKYAAGDTKAKEKMARLHMMAYPD